jgi:hypothetical protein
MCQWIYPLDIHIGLGYIHHWICAMGGYIHWIFILGLDTSIIGYVPWVDISTGYPYWAWIHPLLDTCQWIYPLDIHIGLGYIHHWICAMGGYIRRIFILGLDISIIGSMPWVDISTGYLYWAWIHPLLDTCHGWIYPLDIHIGLGYIHYWICAMGGYIHWISILGLDTSIIGYVPWVDISTGYSYWAWIHPLLGLDRYHGWIYPLCAYWTWIHPLLDTCHGWISPDPALLI